jgi:hypothetical protein
LNDRFALEDGVGCEACHGAAQNWKAEHYKWQNLPNKAELQDSYKMARTEDLTVRAEKCVVCHVGSSKADVNHDLIAAGHPRLNFEFGAYHANMPHHWREEKDRANRPDFEARAWVIGQIVSAKAALELLAFRAAKENDRPWPEFAEYDCFACHHDLQAKSWRQERGYASRKAGELIWGTWYMSMLPRAVEAVLERSDPIVSTEIKAVEAEMQKLSPVPSRVAERAHKLAGRLQQLEKDLDHLHFDQKRLRVLLATIRQSDEKLTAQTWDNAAQFYLTIVALHQARRDSEHEYKDPSLRATLEEMAKQLEFPERYDSPRNFAPLLRMNNTRQ